MRARVALGDVESNDLRTEEVLASGEGGGDGDAVPAYWCELSVKPMANYR